MVDEVVVPLVSRSEIRQPQVRPHADPPKGGRSRFVALLDEKSQAEEVRFSQHARERLKAREINLSGSDLEKLNGAVEKVAKKGGKESLVLLGDSALVVSIKNRTVVTVLDREKMGGNVFTNIDSAVLVT